MIAPQLHNQTDLFHQFADGSDEAFDTIFALFKDRLFRVALNYVKSAEDADEVVQDAFVKLWEGRNLLLSVSNPENYLLTIVRNKAIDRLRKMAADQKLRAKVWEGMQTLVCETESNLFAEEGNTIVQQAVNKMSPQLRTIFKLSREEGLSHDQIAHQLQISKNTVKNQLVSSLKLIKNLLARHIHLLFIAAAILPA